MSINLLDVDPKTSGKFAFSIEGRRIIVGLGEDSLDDELSGKNKEQIIETLMPAPIFPLSPTKVGVQSEPFPFSAFALVPSFCWDERI